MNNFFLNFTHALCFCLATHCNLTLNTSTTTSPLGSWMLILKRTSWVGLEMCLELRGLKQLTFTLFSSSVWITDSPWVKPPTEVGFVWLCDLWHNSHYCLLDQQITIFDSESDEQMATDGAILTSVLKGKCFLPSLWQASNTVLAAITPKLCMFLIPDLLSLNDKPCQIKAFHSSRGSM